MNSLLSNKKSVTSYKLPINKFLNFLYLLLSESNYHGFFLYFGLSVKSITIFKTKSWCVINDILRKACFLRDPGLATEIDETVLNRREL